MATEVKNTAANTARPVTETTVDADNGRSMENIQLGYEKNKKTINTIATLALVVIAGVCAKA